MNRIRLVLRQIDNNYLDYNYDYYIHAFIYSALGKVDKHFSTFIHEEGFKLGGKKFKMFNFSNLLSSGVRTNNKGIHFTNKTYLIISSPVEQLSINLLEYFTSVNRIRIGSCEFRIDRVEFLKSIEFGSKATFRTISPVIVRTQNDLKQVVYLNPFDSKFSENIRNNLINKYIVINNVVPKNTDLKVTIGDVRRAPRQFKGIRLIAYEIKSITLEGSSELIDVAYKCGIGDNNSIGFGMLEVV